MIIPKRILCLNVCGLAGWLVCVMLIAGCHGLSLQPKPVNVDPVIPMSLSREELVAHINRHSRELSSWRCLDTQIKIRMPNGLRHRLSGMIACEAPSNFRLTARNVLASADLGTNHDICWFYMKPGDSPLIMWSHDDAELLDQVELGFPRIEPRWLMNVLGVVPLRPEDFSLSTGPAGSKELWLQAIVEKPNGEAVRRAIKVDTMTGHVREHVIYDADRNPIIRANLSNYKTVDGNVLPTTVALEFPKLDMEIELSFPKIEPNAVTPQNLWQMPTGSDHVMNLGHEIRRQLNVSNTRGQDINRVGFVQPEPGQPYSGQPQAGQPYSGQTEEQRWVSNERENPFQSSHHGASPEHSPETSPEHSPFFPEPSANHNDGLSEIDNGPEVPIEPEWDTPPPTKPAEKPRSRFRMWPWSRQ